jgi:hypothetical protein
MRTATALAVLGCLSAAVLLACGTQGAVRTAAQRIDDAAAVIGRAVGVGGDEVENTLRLTLRTKTDDELAATLERFAAEQQSTWKTKAWNAAKTAAGTAAEVSRNDVVSVVADVTCEGLERWEDGQDVTDLEIRRWTSSLMSLPENDPAVIAAADRAVAALNYHGQGDMNYISWVRATACFVDAIP